MTKLVVETEKCDPGWWWNVIGPWIRIEGQRNYKTKAKAKAAAHEFINRCLTDRETWPEEFT